MPRVKRKEHENLSASNVQKVIKLLEADKPITKKEACGILNIAYNTTRLQRIIEEYKENQAFIAKRKAQNRGKPASQDEITQTIEEYLKGESVSEISKGLFRSPGFVRAIIEKIGVPQRPTGETKQHIGFIPDACIADTFSPREIVWSEKYHKPAIILKELPKHELKYSSKCYQIYVLEESDSSETLFPYVSKGGFYAYQPAYDLGRLNHLEEYGVDLNKL